MNKKQNPTDRFLILKYKAGDRSVLPELVKRYHKAFCQKAYWITKDKEIAKDVAQESWIVIIDKLHTLQNVNSFKSWAYRIVYTKAIDGIKNKHKEDKNLKHTGSLGSDEENDKDERDLILNSLSKAITKLTKQKQDIIRLFYAEEYSIAEISKFLNIPIGTVKSRLFKAREKLKSIINK